ncbi:Rrf2 family transcriptional regulator [Limnohabitans sp.]|uniref:RrF2 family transcriptional regulator n=1 Tax=Limnohabitans sp. TaxID=1907725 RepID=UPI00333FD72D
MISKKTINAIEVCVFLASQRSLGYVTTTELSPRLGLSISYLENILKPLKENNIVTAMKGPGGGYMIRGDVSLLSVWDIAAVFECTFIESPVSNEADVGVEAEPVTLASYELGLEQIVKDTLSNFTLADFVDYALVEVKSYAKELGRFKFKPLPAPFIPKAPNSVFQLHMSF